MKNVFFLTVLLFSAALIAQTETIAGTYIMKLKSSNASFEDTLILNTDGTFTFHEHDWHEGGIPPERNKYGKGQWRIENNIVYFSASESEIDDKFTLDFSNSQARYITKSPRDKSDRIIPTSLQFYQSDIFWMMKRKLVKQ